MIPDFEAKLKYLFPSGKLRVDTKDFPAAAGKYLVAYPLHMK
jgi:hypothetical protein